MKPLEVYTSVGSFQKPRIYAIQAMLKSQSQITSESFNLSDSHIKLEPHKPLEKEKTNNYSVKIKIKELYNCLLCLIPFLYS